MFRFKVQPAPIQLVRPSWSAHDQDGSTPFDGETQPQPQSFFQSNEPLDTPGEAPVSFPDEIERLHRELDHQDKLKQQQQQQQLLQQQDIGSLSKWPLHTQISVHDGLSAGDSEKFSKTPRVESKPNTPRLTTFLSQRHQDKDWLSSRRLVILIAQFFTILLLFTIAVRVYDFLGSEEASRAVWIALTTPVLKTWFLYVGLLSGGFVALYALLLCLF